jgi:beta-galactosidase
MESMSNKVKIIYGDYTLGVSGTDFHYIFSYQTGGMESLYAAGKEWLYRTPKPTFWRALTDNDRGNGFHLKSGMWFGADMFIRHTGVEVSVEGNLIPLPTAPENNRYHQEETAEKVGICFSYETITVPKTTVKVTYCVSGDGVIHIKVEYKGKEGLPELPAFGMRFVMPTVADGFRYMGLSGETYPDRMDGGVRGVYEADGLPVTPYLVPQECGMHMSTEWLEIYRSTELDNRRKEKRKTALRIQMEKEPFAFSCLPYTAQELENAAHQEELPPARRTVLCVMGAVRGVGGIDSWGADVEEKYRIDAAKDITYSFSVKPICCD